MRISDWSSDVCSSDLQAAVRSAVESMSSVRAGEGELARQVILGATGGAVLLALLIAIVLGRGLTGPIRQMAGSMRRPADGDLEVEVPGQARKDAIADIAKAVQVFQENAQCLRATEAAQIEAGRRTAAEQRRAMEDV